MPSALQLQLMFLNCKVNLSSLMQLKTLNTHLGGGFYIRLESDIGLTNERLVTIMDTYPSGKNVD